MTDANLEAGFFSVNEDTRTVRGLLVPYGEATVEAHAYPARFARGSLTIPADVSHLNVNLHHNRDYPVARFTSVEDTDAGLLAEFAIARTPEGDDFLAQYKAGTLRRLSAEVRDIVRRGIDATATLVGAAFVSQGAFASSALFALDSTPVNPTPIESDPNDMPPLEPVDGVLAVDATTLPESVAVTVEGETSTYTPEQEPEEDMPAATVPEAFSVRTSKSAQFSVSKLGDLIYAAREGKLTPEDFATEIKGQNGSSMFALSDVKLDGTGGIGATVGMLPQWIGEVWNAVNYRQQVLPLFNHADLTSLTINGFRWTQKPAGGDWAGNKADIPSNTLTAQAVTSTAARYAVGHDIAREFVDFNVPGFFESYAAAVSEDYARWADAKVATAAVAGATTLAGDALTTLPGPTGGTIGSAASAIIDGATALVTLGTLPDFALVAPALWKQLAKQPTNNVIGYLNASLGLGDGDLAGFTIRPSASVAAGKVLVGARSAVTVYELPGAPIRIDALDLARGGVDKAAFGYLGTVVNDARGLQLVTAATA